MSFTTNESYENLIIFNYHKFMMSIIHQTKSKTRKRRNQLSPPALRLSFTWSNPEKEVVVRDECIGRIFGPGCLATKNPMLNFSTFCNSIHYHQKHLVHSAVINCKQAQPSNFGCITNTQHFKAHRTCKFRQTYHNRVDNIVVGSAQCLDSFVARNIRLGHDQLDILLLNASGVHLKQKFIISCQVTRYGMLGPRVRKVSRDNTQEPNLSAKNRPLRSNPFKICS